MNEEKIKKYKSPLSAIRAKCVDCCCGQEIEVKLCPCGNCPLHEFRFGKNPYLKRVLTEEQRKQAIQNLSKKSVKSSGSSGVE